MKIRISIPIRLVSEANAREHHYSRSRRAKSQRSITTLAVTAHLRSLGVDARRIVDAGLDITITRVAPRELDSDNNAGSCKHVQDGVADALGLTSDRQSATLAWSYAQRKGAVGQYSADVTITVREGARQEEHAT